MKKSIKNFCRMLIALLLCTGLVFVGCTDGPLGENENSEHGGSGGNENGSGTGDTNAIINTSGGVTLSVSLRNLTETGVAFYGKARLEENYTADSFGILYSEDEAVTAANAEKIPIVDIYGEDYTVSTSSLKPNTTYYYTSYIKQGDLYKYGEVKSFVTVSLVAPTLNAASDITEVSSTISGVVSVALGTAGDLEYGFQYCVSEDFSSDVISKKITSIDSENKFSLQITDLVPMTTYYYRSYIKMNGVYGYGEAKSFTTVSLVAPTLNAASDITYDSATISGKVNLPTEIVPGLEYGFQYSQSKDFALNVTNEKVTELDSNNAFAVSISSLVDCTTYYYRSYIMVREVVVYGELKSFSSLEFVSTLPSGYINLASTSSANCYIVSQSGSYCFPVVKGNASSDWLYQTTESDVLWESFGTSTAPSVGDLVKSVSYGDGYIAFKTADTFKEGNAVIAAKDADGNILWSWHIWLTDQPQEQVYYKNAGTMMDRNLGATSAIPGDVGALGLLYQWGRKDPFLGSSSISSSLVAKSTITWPSAVPSNSRTGTIVYATTHPTRFITDNNINNDWYYTGSSSTDNTRWTTPDKTKSIYDPCPSGWRVPDSDNGVWSEALGSSFDFNDSSLYDSTNKGMNFSGKFGNDQTVWYPAAGYRYYENGSLIGVGNYGDYWGADTYSNHACGLFFNNDGLVRLGSDSPRAFGSSVRCVRE